MSLFVLNFLFNLLCLLNTSLKIPKNHHVSNLKRGDAYCIGSGRANYSRSMDRKFPKAIIMHVCVHEDRNISTDNVFFLGDGVTERRMWRGVTSSVLWRFTGISCHRGNFSSFKTLRPVSFASLMHKHSSHTTRKHPLGIRYSRMRKFSIQWRVPTIHPETICFTTSLSCVYVHLTFLNCPWFNLKYHHNTQNRVKVHSLHVSLNWWCFQSV
jgi:hypothetical protein